MFIVWQRRLECLRCAYKNLLLRPSVCRFRNPITYFREIYLKIQRTVELFEFSPRLDKITFYDYALWRLCCKVTRDLMTFDYVIIFSILEEKRTVRSIILMLKRECKCICTIPPYPNLWKRIVVDVGFLLMYGGNRTKIALLFWM